ncbi:MAG: hypothetical protein FWE31_00025 [Firmicutes bacterium]|nr:hypothetical protein [Bacillota bacterium]
MKKRSKILLHTPFCEHIAEKKASATEAITETPFDIFGEDRPDRRQLPLEVTKLQEELLSVGLYS